MDYKYLDKSKSPEALRAMPAEDIEPLIDEIRNFLIEKVSLSGGHLASNLGVVELTVAMHRVFNSPKDHFIFDVGHQAYVHKLLTGRGDRFDTLRTPGGLSGFTSMKESRHDAFGAGHSSTSLSAALGYAESDRLSGSDAITLCVIGDGAYTGGMVHEAINNCKPELKMIIILNENGMSISPNKGAFARYLSSARMSKGYIGWKRGTTHLLNKLPLIGKPVKAFLSFMKNFIKKIVLHPNYFEELGFYYIGTIDGNDYKKVEHALEAAKRVGSSVIVHLRTKKGKGLPEAENSPEVFHSVAGSVKTGKNFHSEFADELIELAKKDERVVAITAAMGIGTGLSAFEEHFVDRYFDVGIAEDHALTFAAGLAAGGKLPFAAIYSTFLQRGYDSIVHDIALQGLPVKLFIDRAGLAVGDGATHHGIFDVSFLSHIPGIDILVPATYGSLRTAVNEAYGSKNPIAVRYPNAAEDEKVKERFYSEADYGELSFRCDFDIENPPSNIYVTYGNLARRAIDAEDELKGIGVSVGTVLVERIIPRGSLLELLGGFINSGSRIVYAEEGIKCGGAAMQMLSALVEAGYPVSASNYFVAAIDDSFVSPDAPCDIYDYIGLSKEKLIRYFSNE